MLTNGSTAIDGVSLSAGAACDLSGGKLCGRSGCPSWNTTSGRAEVLQAVRAERLDACQRRQVIAAEVVRRLGQQRLAAVACRQQTRNPVQRRAEIITVAQLDRTRMERHAHAELGSFRPRLPVNRTLRVEGRRHRVGRRVERRAEGIAAGLENVAVVIVDAMAQQGVVARKGGAHRHGVRFPQPRAALDVGEEQRDGAGREVCHSVVVAREGRTPRMIPGPACGPHLLISFRHATGKVGNADANAPPRRPGRDHGVRLGVSGHPRRGRRRVRARKCRHPDVAQHGRQGSRRSGRIARPLLPPRCRADPHRSAE